ncbi:hypothetical protein EE612_006029 [Oryza sativa]|nr:hypothetical protein EE612_006029 [Oryza sativa]
MRAEDDDAGGGEFVGARLDAGLRAARFASPPSADEFAAAVEPRNAPAVFRGVVKDWTASSRWDPRRGGLDYLRVWIDPSFYLYLAHMRRQWERYLVSVPFYFALCNLRYSTYFRKRLDLMLMWKL